MLGPGDTFERYAIDALLGQGGMGCVYRARDTRLERRVALKVIADSATPSPEANARLLREARAAAALDHPNAVAIFDVGVHEDRPFIVMEFVPGRTLRDAIGHESVPLHVRLSWLLDTARALAAAHKKGLVHRDVKPENVMVREDGVVKVLDFGIARRVSPEGADPHGPTSQRPLTTLTAQGSHVGTPHYMAPEQIKGGPLDGRADQFSWGLLAYELCAGRHPWHEKPDALSVLAALLTEDVDPAPLASAKVPARARAVILRALEKRPEDRFASMDELVRALEPLVASGSPPDPPDPPAVQLGPAKRVDPGTPGKSTTLLEKFTTEQVKELLSRALEKQSEAADTRLGFEELAAAAAEVGVDAETLREASRELRGRAQPDDHGAHGALEPHDGTMTFDEWASNRRRGFLRHALIYLIVCAFLAGLNQLLGGVIPLFANAWFWLLPALGWGLGVAIHAVTALLPDRNRWRLEQAWWRQRRARLQQRHERKKQVDATVDRAIDEGVSLLLAASSTLRDRWKPNAPSAAGAEGIRVAPGPSPEAPRVEDDPDTGRRDPRAKLRV